MSFILLTPRDVQMHLAARFRELRVYRNLKRKTVAEQSGVSEASIKRFEVSGEISLSSLLKVAHVLGGLEEFHELFPLPKARSLEDIEKQEIIAVKSSRKRGRR